MEVRYKSPFRLTRLCSRVVTTSIAPSSVCALVGCSEGAGIGSAQVCALPGVTAPISGMSCMARPARSYALNTTPVRLRKERVQPPSLVGLSAVRSSSRNSSCGTWKFLRMVSR